MTTDLAGIRPVILCGGTGKRLWPMSRRSMPKQFARLSGDATLLQATHGRMARAGCRPPLCMTSEDYRFLVAEQMAEAGSTDHQIVIEPEARNTAAAICAAAVLLQDEDPDAVLLIAPADHLIADEAAFVRAIDAGARAAREGALVTLGIRPDRPDTGFGYIETAAGDLAPDKAVPFERFVEKPDPDAAQAMVESGRFHWNSGLFLFTIPTVLEAFAAHAPRTLAAVRRSVEERHSDLGFVRLSDAYDEAEDISIDHAIFEHDAGQMVPVAMGWNDLGNWQTVWQETQAGPGDMSLTGSVTDIDCQSSILRSESEGVHVVGIGLKDIAVVATRDAVLVADLDKAQDVGTAVEKLRAAKIPQADSFRQTHRPWGHYETLALGPRFQVKSIVVNPGGQLSLQSHVHRAEHWVVVEGTATVTIGEEVVLVSENQSVYIPLGTVHRLANAGKLPLRLIEVQTGAYLGEDDIVRYDDIYDRP